MVPETKLFRVDAVEGEWKGKERRRVWSAGRASPREVTLKAAGQHAIRNHLQFGTSGALFRLRRRVGYLLATKTVPLSKLLKKCTE